MSNELANDCVANFLTLLEEGSQTNGDATGVFGERFTWKKPIAYDDLKDKKVSALKKCIRQDSTNWLVGHNRFTTQGTEKKNENNHPFDNNTCTVVHNGCLSNDDALKRTHDLTYEAETDSAVIPALIEKFVNSGVSEVDALKNTAELLTGSYSVVVKMRKSGRLFYFKNGSTSFTFVRMTDYEGNSTVYGSTSANSLKELGYIKSSGIFKSDLYKERTVATPESGVLYELVYKDELSVEPICNFTVKTNAVTYGNSKWDYNEYSGAWSKGRTISNIHDDWYVDVDTGESIHKDDVKDADQLQEIDDSFEECMREIAYISDVDEKEVVRQMELIDVNYHEGRKQITLHEVPLNIGTYLSTYLNSTEWFNDKTQEGTSNHTINYDDVYKLVEDGLIYSSYSSIDDKDDDEDGDSSCTPLAVMP